jgi:hypothetical protein
LAVSVALMLLKDNKDTALANKVHKWTRIPIPLAWVLTMVVLTLLEFVI